MYFQLKFHAWNEGSFDLMKTWVFGAIWKHVFAEIFVALYEFFSQALNNEVFQRPTQNPFSTRKNIKFEDKIVLGSAAIFQSKTC